MSRLHQLSALLALALPLFTTASPVDLSALFRRQDVDTPQNASLPNVTIYATGGTIASQGTSNTQTIGYSVGLGVQQLVDAVPEILNIANIDGYQVSNVDSGRINSTILLNLTQLINAELAKESVAGVVITHGTDTLEETAMFLDLTINSTKPVVIVGAMRPATALSADGPLNLLQAVTLATSEVARGRGVMISLNDRIGSALYTTEMHANAPDTFYATEQGQLGFYINQANGALVNASYESGAEGIVFAGVGAGGLTPAYSLAAQELYNATGIPMVASHRSPDGFAPIDEDDEWIIGSGPLNPQKSRVMLQLAIEAGFGNGKIRSLFAGTMPDADA
ncbi:hypothetical protein H2201_003648 [Coniosporium apollinis]|uniref:Asparaginase n=2 Tax=Coniosporium TaxID=2810619 RepID=A0ABQ9NY40_9PEZI|nr:hypothetical protein H2199_002810 [Cladosporium sp. JES 115]KAJ9666214.1 hypothetical protein H2201_003648 [Coniosporium apollinis]